MGKTDGVGQSIDITSHAFLEVVRCPFEYHGHFEVRFAEKTHCWIGEDDDVRQQVEVTVSADGCASVARRYRIEIDPMGNGPSA